MEEIGGYRLERQIGAGGMGSVWLAHDAEDRMVAFKLLHPHISRDPNARARLAREVELLHRVRGPRVAQVMDAEVDDDEAFVVTELIDGPTLAKDVETDGPFNERELAGLAIGLAEALRSIHRVGVIHRDLKPGNVMMSPAGPVIIDFGIAQIADDTRLTQTGMVTGTPGYLDPEVINGGDVSETCDWWAWAAVLAFAATGRLPYGTGPALTVIKRMSDHAVDLEGVEPLRAQALRSALHPDPAKRLDPESVMAVLDGSWGVDELQDALEELGVGIPPSIAPPSDGDTWVLDESTAVTPAPTQATHRVLPEPAHEPIRHMPYPAPYAPVGGPWEPAPPAPIQPPPWALPAPPRRGLILSVGALFVALAALLPIWSLGLLTIVTAICGAWGAAAEARRNVTMRHGNRRGDGARVLAAVPWYLLRSIAAAVFCVALAIGSAWAFVVLLVRDDGGLLSAPFLWGVAGVAALLVWFGPGSRWAREGARTAVRDLFPLRPMRIALMLIAVVGIGVVVSLLVNGQEPTWMPLSEPPIDILETWP